MSNKNYSVFVDGVTYDFSSETSARRFAVKAAKTGWLGKPVNVGWQCPSSGYGQIIASYVREESTKGYRAIQEWWTP